MKHAKSDLIFNIDILSALSSHPQVAIDTVISFRCATGYKMHGPTEVKCNEKGQWSESFPRCECK